MSNYGRGWNDGYSGQSAESIEEHWDNEAKAEGDWEWLEKSPRQKRTYDAPHKAEGKAT